MSGKLLSAVLLAAVCGAAPALADLASPAELPPPSYQGQQYVDSRGCVFLRAGYGGAVTWVPRFSRDRKQLCGHEPTGGAAAAAAPEPAAQPLPKAKPAAPEVKAPKAAAKAVAKKPASKPVSASAPKAAAGGAAQKSAKSALAPPPGYKLAWKDDRLNPNRGKQTVEGFLAMDEVWTRTIPAELREESTIKRSPVTIILRRADGSTSELKGYVLSSKGGEKLVQVKDSGEVLTVKSTKSAVPEAAAPKPAAPGRFLVQVGTFGAASNAEGAAGRLKGHGLPVARGKLKGGALTVVYAGPFASAAAAKRALTAARDLGFSDARIVQ